MQSSLTLLPIYALKLEVSMDIWFNIVLNCEDGMGWFLYVKFNALLGWFIVQENSLMKQSAG